MKKLFFFRSSANNNPSLTGVNDDQATDRARNSFRNPRGSSRTRKQVLENSTSGTSPRLRRSLSFSSAALDEGALGQKYSSFFINQNESPCSSSNIPRKGADRHSYRWGLWLTLFFPENGDWTYFIFESCLSKGSPSNFLFYKSWYWKSEAKSGENNDSQNQLLKLFLTQKKKHKQKLRQIQQHRFWNASI